MLTINEILKSTGGRLISGTANTAISGISIDSRTVKEGELFVSIKGDKFDGHEFIEDAIMKGASGAVVQEGHPILRSLLSDIGGAEFNPVPVLIAVNDTLSALQEMARYHRDKFRIPVIGVTGSNGKTTTKEMLWFILSHRVSALKNEENLNNHIGVPLTLFRLNPSYNIAVIEMGISDRGELTRLCQIAHPTAAVITNVGPTHLEKLERIENVAEAKGEILSFIKSDGMCILNRDDTFFDIFKTKSSGRVVSFGMSPRADVYTESADIAPEAYIKGRSMDNMKFRLICPLGEMDINMHVIGLHNLYNALCAAATACALGTKLEDIKYGLEKFIPVKMRSVIEHVGGIHIINDSYNANPASMVAAIDTLKSLKEGNKKYVVMGDMLELGENTITSHRDLGIYIAGAGVDGLIAVGDFADYVADGAIDAGMHEDKVQTCRDYTLTLEKIKQWVKKGDILLVKGSRGMKMERIVGGLKESLH